MRLIGNIHLILVVSFALIASAVRAQNPYDLPMACAGSLESYWVKGFNGLSDFEWTIIDPNGEPVSSNFYSVIGATDTLQMYWSSNLPGGIYTFRVVEHAYGCIGEAYEQHILLNTSDIYIPFDGVPETVEVCFGEMARLDPGQFQSYIWQDEVSSRIYYTGQSGTYRVKLINSQHECTYNEIEAFVHPLPVVNLGNDTVLFGAQVLDLDVGHPNIAMYEWSNGSIMPNVTVGGGEGTQVVWVNVTDHNGCSNSDSITVVAADYRNLRVPKAFTPNGDGVNDTWVFPAPNSQGFDLYTYLDDVTVRVFNRWGKLVWKSDGMFREWNGRDLSGRDLPMDSYHYIIRINVDDSTFEYKGSVTIVR